MLVTLSRALVRNNRCKIMLLVSNEISRFLKVRFQPGPTSQGWTSKSWTTSSFCLLFLHSFPLHNKIKDGTNYSKTPEDISLPFRRWSQWFPPRSHGRDRYISLSLLSICITSLTLPRTRESYPSAAPRKYRSQRTISPYPYCPSPRLHSPLPPLTLVPYDLPLRHPQHLLVNLHCLARLQITTRHHIHRLPWFFPPSTHKSANESVQKAVQRPGLNIFALDEYGTVCAVGNFRGGV